jgi:hypothetical protein
MSNFILDKTPKIDDTLTLAKTDYRLKYAKGSYEFHITDNDEPEVVYLTKQDLKALFILLNTTK